MSRHLERHPDAGKDDSMKGYEPPRVEQALTPADIAREVLYAGRPTADEFVDE